jgi:hypothetical protein
MLDKKTATANLSLALKLAIFSTLLFAGAILVGELVVHA